MAITKKKYTTEEILNEVKLFILTGPMIVGWIFGILYYPINSAYFMVSLQNALISMLFIVIYGFFNVINIFFDIISENVLLYIESFISLVYLGTTLFCYTLFKQKERIAGLKFLQSLLDRLFLSKDESC